MGFAKGTILGKHKRDDQGRLLNKDGSLYKLPERNDGHFQAGVRFNPSTEFKRGHTPHNKGRRLKDYVPEHSIKKMQNTQFKKGTIPPNTQPKGTISRRINKGNIEYLINIDWHGNRKHDNSYRWYLWEVENQQDRPKGMILTVKNGDADDIRLENLELITRAENLRRNRNHA